ncbi:MAG TPA: SMC-Scp complex subunit ScpB [Candidatus Eisenbacteria bacterium]|jgi:segregation and condensation protein B|nr:SMC-Scp complex subunit ScpB [Candidatus Eisenbacteria bacterium]
MADELKHAIEALLFASERPLQIEEIREAFEEALSAEDVKKSLAELRAEYEAQGRGFRLFEIAGGYQLVTDPRFEGYLKKFYAARMKKKLSQATLETLSIVAYRQPVTRADIEFIRGVNVDGAVKTLLEKGLIKIAGKKEVPGRPLLYATTPAFLEHFGLNSVKDLPALNQYTEKDLDPSLLPPEMKRPEAAAEPGAETQADTGDPTEADGEQKPVGCANEPEEEPKDEDAK